MTNSILLEEAKQLVSPLYLVGGCVRDELMARVPNDYDFTTALTPEQIIEAIESKSKKAYKIGARYGTIGVKLNGQLVEITTFRAEKYSSKNRKPEVEFVNDITADLSRRDFTMNAIARRIDDNSNKLIDPFYGIQDILDKKIRAVGNATLRFNEDPLRMLRACRFASQLGFEIEANTMKSMQRKAHHILEVSRERWMQEMDKLLMGDYALYGLLELEKSGLLRFMFPELQLQVNFNQDNPHHKKTLWEHTTLVVANAPKDINLRWAALLHDVAKPATKQMNEKGYANYLFHDLIGPEMIERIAKYLKWSNERTLIVKDLVLHHLEENSPLREADNNSKQ